MPILKKEDNLTTKIVVGFHHWDFFVVVIWSWGWNIDGDALDWDDPLQQYYGHFIHTWDGLGAIMWYWREKILLRGPIRLLDLGFQFSCGHKSVAKPSKTSWHWYESGRKASTLVSISQFKNTTLLMLQSTIFLYSKNHFALSNFDPIFPFKRGSGYISRHFHA